MNQCILMAEVVEPPQIRYTQDNQTAVAEMTIQFPGLRPDDPAATVKAVGWGNLAQELQDRCQMGDRYIFEGRLRMNSIDRSEGFKEKKAELTVSKVHSLTGEESPSMGSPSMGSSSAPASAPAAASGPPRPAARAAKPTPAAPTPAAGISKAEPDYDDIPF